MTGSRRPHLFAASLAAADPVIHAALSRDLNRQQSQIELIASENTVSLAVLEALGATIVNKTLEGYPGARFHGGGDFADIAEREAIDRARRLFGAAYANVQPHSGTQANQAAFFACVNPGETVLSMALAAGGHLSHGATPNVSGRWFNAVAYGVDPQTGLIDYDEAARLAEQHRPKLVIAGGSAYPRIIDFVRLRDIANSVGALFLVDMAHVAGLVAAGCHPNPVDCADIVTCTTTKTLRGPRGGLILSRRDDLARRLDAAVFPGVQGSIHTQVIAAKAVCLGEALQPEFADYGAQVVANARALAAALMERGFPVQTGGTDTHLVLVDTSRVGLTGDAAEKRLGAAGITCNRNPLPGDPPAPARWRGIRLGTAAGTTRGFDAGDFDRIGHAIADLLSSAPGDGATLAEVRSLVGGLCERRPLYARPF